MIQNPTTHTLTLKDHFLASHTDHQTILIPYISQNSSERLEALKQMSSDQSGNQKSSTHISNYLAYYRSLNGTMDIFQDHISD